MRERKHVFGWGISVVLFLASGSAQAADPIWGVNYGHCQPSGTPCYPRPAVIGPPPTPETARPETGKPPADQAQQDPTQPQTDAFNQTPESGTEAAQSANPQMIGDFIGYQVCRKVPVSRSVTSQSVSTFVISPGLPPIISFGSPSTSTSQQSVTLCETIASRGGFKIADNESPRPMTRVFGTYTFYNNLGGEDTFLPPLNTSTPVGPNTVVNTTAPGLLVTGGGGDAHREVFGFEYAMFGNAASVGIRAPIFQQNGDGSFDQDDFGDLSVVLKYALVNDPYTGNVFCGGLVVTAPTGPEIHTIDGDIHSTLLQPYIGYLLNGGPFYVHGFMSVAIPTDTDDVTVMFNDIGLGYYLMGYDPMSLISFVVPTFEVHVTTPLDNHDHDVSGIFVPDIVVLTGGVHFGVGASSVLTTGIGVPVTGPQPYDIQAFAQLNFRF